MTQDQINQVVRAYFARVMSQATEIVLLGPKDPDFHVESEIANAEEGRQMLHDRIAQRDYAHFTRRDVFDLLNENGLTSPDESSNEFDALCNGVLRAQAEQCRILIAMLEGRYDLTEPADPLFKGVSWGSPAIPGGSAPTAKETVSALAEKYLSLKSMQDWVPKTRKENERVLKLFADIVGGDKPIKMVTLEDVREFRDKLLKLPANYTKPKKFAAMSVAEILKATNGEVTLSGKTSWKYFANLKSFLGWCVDEGYIEKSPAQKIKIAKKSNAADARYPFSAAQLTSLFQSPQYVGHKSASIRAKPGVIVEKDGKYWVPLVALFTGMRLGEIVQLRITDIKQHSDVWYFDVSKGEGEHKQLKTASSQRVVPLHPTLIKLGFLDHIEMSRSINPEGRVFPDIQPGADGYFSHNFSKYFGRYARQIGIKTAKTSFHSFRHNFKDALVKANVEDSRIKVLLGHADNSVTSGYGSKIPVETLFGDISKIGYEVSLETLYTPQKT
jgi:integrase